MSSIRRRETRQRGGWTHRSAKPGQRPALLFIVASNVLLGFGFRVWQSLFNNFAIEELGLSAFQISIVQVFREVPGLIGFGAALLALIARELRIASVSVILLGAGIALTGSAGSLDSLIASTVIMSFGFHYFVSTSSSAVLHIVDEERAPRVLGRLSSLSSLAAVAATVVVFFTVGRLGFRPLFYGTGILIAAAALVLDQWSRRNAGSAAMPPQPDVTRLSWLDHVKRPFSALRRRYVLYYALELLMGSRRHIFTTFAVFLLVKEHGVPAQTFTLLLAVTSLLGTLAFRHFGAIIARFGERRVLATSLFLIALVFVGYAYIPLLPILLVLFTADHLLFGFSIALQSYLHKIALSPEDITPNLTLGQSINHVAAVIVPLAGGAIWEAVGARYTFLAGVAIAAVTLLVVSRIGKGDDQPQTEQQAHAQA